MCCRKMAIQHTLKAHRELQRANKCCWFCKSFVSRQLPSTGNYVQFHKRTRMSENTCILFLKRLNQLQLMNAITANGKINLLL